jgi:phage-related baseplate assembly protein
MADAQTIAGQIDALSAFLGAELDNLAQSSTPLDLTPVAARLTALEQAIRAGNIATGGTASADALTTAIASLQARINAAIAAQTVSNTAPVAVDDLAALPQPRLIIDLDHAATLADLIAAYRTAAATADVPEQAEYLGLESSVERRLLEVTAYAIVWLQHRINEFYRARLVYFSEGADLDINADGYGVDRLTGEPDADLKNRVRIRNRGSSAAGPDDWWRYHALTADEAVEDVAVSRADFPYPAPTQKRGDVYLAILADTPDGVPSAATLARVEAVLTSRSVRPVGTNPIIRAATSVPVTVLANVWLRPDAQPAVFDALETAFRARWATARRMGWNVVRSWVLAALMQPGVQRVELPTWTDVIVPPDAAPRLDAVALVLRGRDF